MGILLTDVLACAAAFLASATFTPAARDLAASGLAPRSVAAQAPAGARAEAEAAAAAARRRISGNSSLRSQGQKEKKFSL